MLREVFSIMRNLCPHIVHHKWLGEVVFVVREWHSLEMKRHHGTTLNISKLIAAHSCVAISIEELCNGRSVLWEVWIVKALFPLLIEIHDVVSFWAEEFSEFFVLEYLVKHPDFIHSGLSTLVTDTSSCH